MFEHYLSIAVKSIFVENMALAFFLGMCSFLAVSKKVETAIGLGAAVIFVLAVCVPLNQLILASLLREGALAWISPPRHVDLSFLSFLVFRSAPSPPSVQVVEMAVDRFAPALRRARRVPPAHRRQLRHPRRLAVHGAARVQLRRGRRLRHRLRHRLGPRHHRARRHPREDALQQRPPGLRGLGIAFILTGLMAIGFLAFSGIQL
jgi:Na+-transporting NADH:ubiquinone oxidoreductase subunit E